MEFLSSRLSRRYLDRLPVEKPPLLQVHKFPLSVVDWVSLTSAEKSQFIKLLRPCWSGVQTDATTPNNVGTWIASWEG